MYAQGRHAGSLKSLIWVIRVGTSQKKKKRNSGKGYTKKNKKILLSASCAAPPEFVIKAALTPKRDAEELIVRST